MIPKKNHTKIAFLTRTIKASWKKSVESLIEIGRCLHELRPLLDRQAYLKHLEGQLSMSEMQAHRLEQLYLKFRDKKSVHVLSSKPSVLYLLASNLDTKRIDSLAKGGKVSVCGSYKTISQLTVKDISLLNHSSKSQKSNNNDDEDDDERDLNRAKNAHRRLATLIEEINDWSMDLMRFKEEKLEIRKKDLVKKYVKETIECLKTLENLLS